MMIRTRFFYTMEELQNGSISPTNQGWDTMINYITGESFTDTAKQGELYNFCIDQYRDHFIAFVDIVHPLFEAVSQPTVAELKFETKYADQLKQLQNQVFKIRGWLNTSSPKYEKLITLYAAQENNLMNQLESSVQFNDTPQTTATGLDADTYATTYTKSKTDPSTVMQRLSEVRVLWDNMYKDWIAEFGKKFIMYN